MTGLEQCRQILEGGGYVVATRELDRLGAVLLAETAYALVMVLELPIDEMDRFVDDAQASLTQLAATHPSPRVWDLYLVLYVGQDGQRYDVAREAFEADTRYARKLVVTGDASRLRRLLLSLLPLAPVPEVALPDPLAEVREHLLGQQIDARFADTALASFRRTGEVEVP